MYIANEIINKLNTIWRYIVYDTYMYENLLLIYGRQGNITIITKMMNNIIEKNEKSNKIYITTRIITNYIKYSNNILFNYKLIMKYIHIPHIIEPAAIIYFFDTLAETQNFMPETQNSMPETQNSMPETLNSQKIGLETYFKLVHDIIKQIIKYNIIIDKYLLSSILTIILKEYNTQQYNKHTTTTTTTTTTTLFNTLSICLSYIHKSFPALLTSAVCNRLIGWLAVEKREFLYASSCHIQYFSHCTCKKDVLTELFKVSHCSVYVIV